MPSNYSYKANIYSVDNLYDEQNHRFTGKSISKTTFSYSTVKTENGVLLIKNLFDVRKPNGEKIFTVQRLYGIDPMSGMHVPGSGDKSRSGYLFGPKNMSKSDFTYWHVNYDLPILMKFEKEEDILGLKTYKFTSKFLVDQTRELSNIPTVGVTRGINLDVKLSIWVEPETGELVSYDDSARAYKKSKKAWGNRLHR